MSAVVAAAVGIDVVGEVGSSLCFAGVLVEDVVEAAAGDVWSRWQTVVAAFAAGEMAKNPNTVA